MKARQRYAIYYTATGALAKFGAAWLGWDIEYGQDTAHPTIEGLTRQQIDAITQIPRRYGFHATLKPPFRLNSGATETALTDDLASLAADQRPVLLSGGLKLALLHGFPAFIPANRNDALTALASRLVRDLDHHRAPLTTADRARRNPDQLTPQQRDNLEQWGYPWVLDEFRFHMTLGERLPQREAAHLIETLHPIIAPILPDPHPIDAVTLAGEDTDGRFHQIARFMLTGE